MHYKELADTVSYFKTTKEGEANMASVIEMYAKNQAEKVAAKVAEETAYQRNIEVAKEMLADNMSIEVVTRISKLSEDEVRALAAKQSA